MITKERNDQLQDNIFNIIYRLVDKMKLIDDVQKLNEIQKIKDIFTILVNVQKLKFPVSMEGEEGLTLEEGLVVDSEDTGGEDSDQRSGVGG